jgi:hypothetical protein
MSVMEYEIHKSTRHCAITGRELQPGEVFYSVLRPAGDDIVREDYSTESWQGPPESIIGWWKSRLPTVEARKVHWAPNDVMLDLFEGFADDPAQADLRYVLALLLIRRRVMRLEDTETGPQGETMVLFCPRRDEEYRVVAAPPDEARVAVIQQELAQLLFANAT